MDEQVKQRGYGTSSEYVRALILKDQARTRLRAMLIEGAASQPIGPPMAPISTACAIVSRAAASGECQARSNAVNYILVNFET